MEIKCVNNQFRIVLLLLLIKNVVEQKVQTGKVKNIHHKIFSSQVKVPQICSYITLYPSLILQLVHKTCDQKKNLILVKNNHFLQYRPPLLFSVLVSALVFALVIVILQRATFGASATVDSPPLSVYGAIVGTESMLVCVRLLVARHFWCARDCQQRGTFGECLRLMVVRYFGTCVAVCQHANFGMCSTNSCARITKLPPYQTVSVVRY